MVDSSFTAEKLALSDTVVNGVYLSQMLSELLYKNSYQKINKAPKLPPFPIQSLF